jgi:D-xylose transport system substrate-binding protein
MLKLVRTSIPLLLLSSLALGNASHALSSAQRQPVASGTTHVAFLLAQLDPRWVRHDQYLNARLKALYPGVELDVFNANGDPTRQLGQADQALAKGAKVLIVNAVEPTDAATIVARAHQERARVIAYDAPIRSHALDLYVSFDEATVGRLQASWLASHVSKGGTIAIINGPKYDNTAKALHQAYSAVLGPRFSRHYFKKAGEYWTIGWDTTGAAIEVERVLHRHRNSLGGILAANDDLASGAISALSMAGSQGRTKVTGQDATADALANILEGRQSMTVYKPVYQEANAAAQATNAFLRGRSLRSVFHRSLTTARGMGAALLFSPIVVTASNARVALGDGLVTKQDVCRRLVHRKLCSKL